MVRKFVLTLMVLAVVGLFAGVSSANQITLANSTSGQVEFSGASPNTEVSFLGNVSGFGLFGGTLGTYQIWQTGSGNPTLTNLFFDIYSVAMGSTVLNFQMVLTDSSTIIGTLSLDELIGGSTRAPEFLGSFTATSVSGQFVNAGYPIGTPTEMDLTVNLHGSTATVSQVYDGTASMARGPISSGEIPGVPEPTTLGLLGSGLLTMAGLLKRRVL
jgi:hypothetical protein